MKKALVIGSQGQDGQLLLKLLTQKGYKVWGVGRGTDPNPNFIPFDLASGDFSPIETIITEEKPDEIYYVAAFHHSSQENNAAEGIEFLSRSVKVNQLGFMNVLEICRLVHPAARVFYTSSSLVFSGAVQQKQNEQTTTAPRCIYSVTKCAAMAAAEHYRSTYNLFVTVGIMYNHESILRKDFFLSKKIVNETRQLVAGHRKEIVVGDLSALTDWGYAPDYAEAMWHLLQQKESGVYIISSGIAHAVKDWFEVLFTHLGMDWTNYVKENKDLIQRKKPVLIGDNSKLVSTGWTPRVSFEDMVIKMYNNSL